MINFQAKTTGRKIGSQSILFIVEDLTLDNTVKDLITSEKFLEELNKSFGGKLGGIVLSNEAGKSFVDHFKLFHLSEDVSSTSLDKTLKQIGHGSEQYVIKDR